MGITDTERLDWLGKHCDIGRIQLDPDLEGPIVIQWSVWNEGEGEGHAAVREAVDAAMRDPRNLNLGDYLLGQAEDSPCQK